VFVCVFFILSRHDITTTISLIVILIDETYLSFQNMSGDIRHRGAWSPSIPDPVPDSIFTRMSRTVPSLFSSSTGPSRPAGPRRTVVGGAVPPRRPTPPSTPHPRSLLSSVADLVGLGGPSPSPSSVAAGPPPSSTSSSGGDSPLREMKRCRGGCEQDWGTKCCGKYGQCYCPDYFNNTMPGILQDPMNWNQTLRELDITPEQLFKPGRYTMFGFPKRAPIPFRRRKCHHIKKLMNNEY